MENATYNDLKYAYESAVECEAEAITAKNKAADKVQRIARLLGFAINADTANHTAETKAIAEYLVEALSNAQGKLNHKLDHVRELTNRRIRYGNDVAITKRMIESLLTELGLD